MDVPAGDTLQWSLQDYHWDGTSLKATPISREPAPTARAPTVATCQVPGCRADLSNLKAYNIRHKICEYHIKMENLVINGDLQRFCQLCARFHPIALFDTTRRTCREKLKQHNERRRKARAAARAAAKANGDPNRQASTNSDSTGSPATIAQDTNSDDAEATFGNDSNPPPPNTSHQYQPPAPFNHHNPLELHHHPTQTSRHTYNTPSPTDPHPPTCTAPTLPAFLPPDLQHLETDTLPQDFTQPQPAHKPFLSVPPFPATNIIPSGTTNPSTTNPQHFLTLNCPQTQALPTTTHPSLKTHKPPATAALHPTSPAPPHHIAPLYHSITNTAPPATRPTKISLSHPPPPPATLPYTAPPATRPTKTSLSHPPPPPATLPYTAPSPHSTTHCLPYPYHSPQHNYTFQEPMPMAIDDLLPAPYPTLNSSASLPYPSSTPFHTHHDPHHTQIPHTLAPPPASYHLPPAHHPQTHTHPTLPLPTSSTPLPPLPHASHAFSPLPTDPLPPPSSLPDPLADLLDLYNLRFTLPPDHPSHHPPSLNPDIPTPLLHDLTTLSLKFFNTTPDTLPPTLQEDLLLLVQDASSYQGCIRPGCTLLTVDFFRPAGAPRITALTVAQRLIAISPFYRKSRILVQVVGGGAVELREGLVRAPLAGLQRPLGVERVSPPCVGVGGRVEVEVCGVRGDLQVFCRAGGKYWEVEGLEVADIAGRQGQVLASFRLPDVGDSLLVLVEVVAASQLLAHQVVLASSNASMVSELNRMHASSASGLPAALLAAVGRILDLESWLRNHFNCSVGDASPDLAPPSHPPFDPFAITNHESRLLDPSPPSSPSADPTQPGPPAQPLCVNLSEPPPRPPTLNNPAHLAHLAAAARHLLPLCALGACPSLFGALLPIAQLGCPTPLHLLQSVQAVNPTSSSLLHLAVGSGSLQMVELLLEWGFQCGVDWGSVDSPGGVTPLHLACGLDDGGVISDCLQGVLPIASEVWSVTITEAGLTPADVEAAAAAQRGDQLPAEEAGAAAVAAPEVGTERAVVAMDTTPAAAAAAAANGVNVAATASAEAAAAPAPADGGATGTFSPQDTAAAAAAVPVAAALAVPAAAVASEVQANTALEGTGTGGKAGGAAADGSSCSERQGWWEWAREGVEMDASAVKARQAGAEISEADWAASSSAVAGGKLQEAGPQLKRAMLRKTAPKRLTMVNLVGLVVGVSLVLSGWELLQRVYTGSMY